MERCTSVAPSFWALRRSGWLLSLLTMLTMPSLDDRPSAAQDLVYCDENRFPASMMTLLTNLASSSASPLVAASA